jgi:hypothetical protein
VSSVSQRKAAAETDLSSITQASTTCALRGWETSLYMLKAGPAGGRQNDRVRRPHCRSSFCRSMSREYCNDPRVPNYMLLNHHDSGIVAF